MSDPREVLAAAFYDPCTGALRGDVVREDVRTIGDLTGVFEDEKARSAMDPRKIVYRVQSYLPVSDGTPGGLFFGTSFVSPGKVGDEFFMTKGHYHAKRDTGEFYWGIAGEGLLVLMGVDRSYRTEKVAPGSVHYIPGNTAHRLVNTGTETLAVGACWQAESGHDYEAILESGFSVRVKEGPRIVEERR